MTKISIITPCYNVAQYVTTTLDSVLRQRACLEFEIICVDDGSTDDTRKVLNAYVQDHCIDIVERDEQVLAIGDEDSPENCLKHIVTGIVPNHGRVCVVQQYNTGVSGARNTALTLAQGDWVFFLDGDDILSPYAFEEIHKCIQKYPLADVIFGEYVAYGDGDLPLWKERRDEVAYLDVSTELPDWLFMACFQRTVFRRNKVSDIAFQGISCSEEMPYVLKALLRVQGVIVSPSTLYGYRWVSGSMSHRGISFKLCNDYFDATRCMTKLMASGEKSFSRGFVRGLINRWTEVQAHNINLLSDCQERMAARAYWLENLPKILRYSSYCSWWQLVVVTLVRTFPYFPVIWLLCLVPYGLKRSGFHR